MSRGTGSAEVGVLSSQRLDPADRLLSGKGKHPSQLWEGNQSDRGKYKAFKATGQFPPLYSVPSHPIISSQIVDEQALATLEAVDGRPPEYTARCGLCVKYIKREHSYGV